MAKPSGPPRSDSCPGCGAPLASEPGGKLTCAYCGRSFETEPGAREGLSKQRLEALKTKREALNQKLSTLKKVQAPKSQPALGQRFPISRSMRVLLALSLLFFLAGVIVQWVFAVLAGILCAAAVMVTALFQSGFQPEKRHQSAGDDQDIGGQELERLRKEIETISQQIHNMERG